MKNKNGQTVCDPAVDEYSKGVIIDTYGTAAEALIAAGRAAAHSFA